MQHMLLLFIHSYNEYIVPCNLAVTCSLSLIQLILTAACALMLLTLAVWDGV